MGIASSKRKRKPAPPKVEVTDADRAVLSLKTQKRKLGATQRQISERIVRAAEEARERVARGDKSGALLRLKQRKVLEVRLRETENYIIRLEEMLMNIEQAKMNNAVFETLREGNDALTTIQQKISITALESLVEDTQAAKDHEATINDILAAENVAIGDVEAELRDLERDVEAETGADLPDVPAAPVKAADPERLEDYADADAKAAHDGRAPAKPTAAVRKTEEAMLAA